jgi:hypothetical protein
MFHVTFRRFPGPFLVLHAAVLTALAQAPFPINGVADRSIYTSAVTLRVPSTAGHTYGVLLDGAAIPTDVDVTVNQADYHELSATRTEAGTGTVTNRLVRFIVRASDRGTTEDGLPPWVPYPMIPSSAGELAGARLDLIVPPLYPAGLEIPVVAWVRNAQGGVVRANGPLTSASHPPIPLRRGVGSGFLGATNPAGVLNYTAGLASLQTNRTIVIEASTTWTSVAGTLGGDTVWGDDSRIAVTGNLTVPAGVTLTILDGSVVRLNAGVNITNLGRIVIEGTPDRPVVFTPVTRGQPWGGFFLTATTSQLDARSAIFVAAGAVQSGFPGHRTEQPLFYLDNRARVGLTNCAAIYLAGQFHHSIDRDAPYATVTMVGCLIQRCTTAGEFNGCSLTFRQSALIEAPYEDPLYCANPDCDHDGFYLNEGIHELRDSLVGWLKDDCLDAGSGGGPSTVTVSNCWLEASYHEGLAWSGGGRTTVTLNSVLINCGQGIECGWSTGTNTPFCHAGGLLTTGNAIGARFGDNYDTIGDGLNGFLRVTNSLCLYNYRDVWGMTWRQGALGWYYRSNQMDIRNNFLTAPNPFHPTNQVWNPATDAGRLAAYMTTPPGAPVGVGLATWSNQFALSALFQGVPVRLSSFTTNPVSVDYAFDSTNGALATGTLTFAPGETVKRIYPHDFDATAQGLVRVALVGAMNGELTGATNVTFQGSLPPVTVACWVATNQMDLARLIEGVAVRLNGPSARMVSVDYSFQSLTGTLAQGTVTFSPGETVKWVGAPGVNPQDHELIRFGLANATAASLANPSIVYFVRTIAAQTPANVTLISRGSNWRYEDSGTNLGTAWRALAYNDSAWSNGLAQLGFGDNPRDETTLIRRNPTNSASSAASSITFYFRQKFTVADPSAFSGLNLWLLRDDAGVVYLNNTEVLRSTNLPPYPTLITNLTRALSTGENSVDTLATNANLLVGGTNILAVEIHQESTGSSDVSFDCELIGSPAPPPPPPQRVYAGVFAGQFVAAWGDPSFNLYHADDVTGPWLLATNRSPFVINFNPQVLRQFYLLRRP